MNKEEKRTIAMLGISLASLILGFLDVGTIRVPLESMGLRTAAINLSWISILLCGIPIVKDAVIGLVTAFDIKADVLVSLALIGSVIIGEIFAAGEVAFIMALGAFLEERTVRKARAGIEKLVHLTPATARVVRKGAEVVIPAQAVEIGEVLRVFAGETIPVDGEICKGETAVDQSVMTGESLPVDKGVGDTVLSGTVNQFGSFDMTAKKVGQDSSLQRMIRLVESADAGKAKIVGLADRWATWIVVVALLAAVTTWVLTGEVIRAVTILVVFCPCALVLATPTAIMAGIGNATRYGILVRQGDALERLAGIKHIAFDKTGTLTHGRPRVVEAVSCQEEITGEALLAMAAAAESRSEHPLGKAITAHFQAGGNLPEQPETFRLLPGKGVFAVVQGRTLYAGNEMLLRECRAVLPPFVEEQLTIKREEGCTVIYIMEEERLLGYIALSDTLRPHIAKTIAAIQETGVSVALLTGDGEAAAMHIAASCGITEVKYGCMPEDKLIKIREYQAAQEPVCMVGDGINDAPALKAAQVGIAMGGVGSDIAIEAADIALVRDDIQEIPHLLMLSKRVMRTINFNLGASMLLNFAAIALAITGILNPVLGALVHNVGSVAVIIHSSFLLKWRKKE